MDAETVDQALHRAETLDAPTTRDPIELSEGKRFGRYELLFPAGSGGMGQVWSAKLRGDQGFRKIVALKTLRPSEAASGRLRRMLLAEAKLTTMVKSPHVVETLDYGDHEGMPYLVMEWVEGASLADLLEATDRPLTLQETLGLILQTCKGLEAAHDATDLAGNPIGVVHCDVSPQNILIGFTGTVKLADFGIANITSRVAGGPRVRLQGKYAFMSPEQVNGSTLDARTDTFAVSVL
jgi:serine/threonine-protein kinase